MKSASVDQILTDVEPLFPDSFSNCAKAEQVVEHGVRRYFKSNDRSLSGVFMMMILCGNKTLQVVAMDLR